MANDYFFDGYRMTKYYDDYLGGHTEDFDFWPACLSGREKILEIACGTGRITIPLLKLGKRITALDYSSEMLELLYRKTEAYRDQLTIVNGDMRNYKLNQRFDAVIITANSVNHLETHGIWKKRLNVRQNIYLSEGSLSLTLFILNCAICCEISSINMITMNSSYKKPAKKSRYMKTVSMTAKHKLAVWITIIPTRAERPRC